MAPLTDIAIPVHNALDALKVCIDAIARTVSDYRLILSDDCSDAATKAFLQEVQAWRTNTVVVTHARRRWFTRNANVCLRLCRTPWAVLLNSDTIPRPGWLDELYDVKDECTKQGMAVGLVGSDLVRGYPTRYELTKEPDYITGHAWFCNLGAFYTASCHRQTPGTYFDETKQEDIHINSDRHLCYLLNKVGYTTVRSRLSEVDHVGGVSWRKPDGYHNLEEVGRLQLADLD